MNNNRTVRVILKDQARIEFEGLNRIIGEQILKGETNSEEMQLMNSIRQKIELVRSNPVYGIRMPKSKIPKELDVSNLFKVELTGYWRMIYSLEGNKVEVIAFILYIIDHPTYDKIFKYRGR